MGIPTSRDKVVQSGAAIILNALYEPLFRDCSHGFRPKHSPITALRQVSSAYRTGATWVIEGDITDCFGSLPHPVILNCLRKRIRDERFIDLIRKMLQAGVMEGGRYSPTYSGAPQGGIVSPILSNIVMHELDGWMETQPGVNPPPLGPQEQNARSNPEYMKLHYRICDIRRYLDGKRPIPQNTTSEALRQELREKLKLRSLQPRSLPRKVMFYSRFADDFVVILSHHSKAEAQQMKTAIADWMHAHLGLTLNQEKTHITHWRKRLRFLGYNLEGRKNPNGTGWLHLSVPKDAVRSVVAKIQRATAYPQTPEYDVFTNVNAIARGWSNYYRYAHNNNVIGGKLSMVTYWQTVHYLAKKHKCSIAKIMRKQYNRSTTTGCSALFTYKPGKPATPENRYFIWHKTPRRQSLASASSYDTQDIQAYINTSWARGHSLQKRNETRELASNQCQNCGTATEELFVHHPKRLRNAKRVKKGAAHVAQAGLDQQTKLLCYSCHLAQHHGNTRQ